MHQAMIQDKDPNSNTIDLQAAQDLEPKKAYKGTVQPIKPLCVALTEYNLAGGVIQVKVSQHIITVFIN